MSLLQAEALLCSSLFYQQQKDGSFNGALPYFLLGDEKNNGLFGFAGFHQHALARINSLELPVSANVNYLFFLTDVLLSVSLHKTTTNNFKRGIQNIEVRGKKLHSMPEGVGFSLVDSEQNDCELGQAMKTKAPNLFVTLTVNKKHFGIAPLFNAIEKMFPHKSSEQYKAAFQLYMPIMLQMWKETIKQLIENLLKSTEHLLGNIIKNWGRAEFQDAVAKFPHYHILL